MSDDKPTPPKSSATPESKPLKAKHEPPKPPSMVVVAKATTDIGGNGLGRIEDSSK
jgi:hypothetical protein